jgi:hypothetical protein
MVDPVPGTLQVQQAGPVTIRRRGLGDKLLRQMVVVVFESVHGEKAARAA